MNNTTNDQLLQELEQEFQQRRQRLIDEQQRHEAEIAQLAESNARRAEREQREAAAAEMRAQFERVLEEYKVHVQALGDRAEAWQRETAAAAQHLAQLASEAQGLSEDMVSLLLGLKREANAHKNGYALTPAHQNEMNALIDALFVALASVPIESKLPPPITNLLGLPNADPIARKANIARTWSQL